MIGLQSTVHEQSAVHVTGNTLSHTLLFVQSDVHVCVCVRACVYELRGDGARGRVRGKLLRFTKQTVTLGSVCLLGGKEREIVKTEI